MPGAEVSQALVADPSDVGRLLLRCDEDQWFERKSFRIEPRRVAEALIAFANADGGVLVVGLSAGKVEGTRSDARHRSALMQAPIDFAQPPVPAKATLYACVNQSDGVDDLLVFEVDPSSGVHATVKDEVLLRRGDESRRLSYSQRRELLYEKGQAAYEAESTRLTLADLDHQLVDDYAARLGAPDPYGLLRARGFIDGKRLTIAGSLLFAREPSQIVPNAHIRVSRFSGTQRGVGARQRLRDDVRIEGPIPRALPLARERIANWQPTRRASGAHGRFDDVALVPQDAWLEGLVNAAVHRSYSLGGDHVHVDIFDDRIEIESPGRFPGLADLSDPLHATRFARNPRIARVYADLRMGQESGEGIRRMFEEMRLAGLADPLYRQTSGSVQLTLSGETVDRALDERLPAETRVIVAALRDSGHLSTGEVSQLIGVARPATIRRLQALRAAGLVEWIGNSSKDPRAFWRARSG